MRDVLEGKVFGIGTESFVVGSHDFYIAYAVKNGIGITRHRPLSSNRGRSR